METARRPAPDAITKFGLFIWMIKCQVGIGILSLPSVVYPDAKNDAWMSVLAAGFAIQIILFAYWKLYQRHPNRILSEMTVELFGRFAGKALNLVYWAYFLLVSGYALVLYVRLIHTWLLPKTPEPVIMALIVGAFLYLSLQSLTAIERFLIFASGLFVLILLLSLTAFTHDMHISYLAPVGGAGWHGILNGSANTFFSMIGFEVVLFLFARVRSDQQGRPVELLPTISAANAFVTLLYTYFVLLCLVSFSPRALALVKDPVLFLFKGLSFQLADRLDLIFLTIWIFAMTSIFVGYLYMAGASLSPKPRSRRAAVWMNAGIVFALGYAFYRFDHKGHVVEWLQYGYFVQIVCLPAIMLALSYAKKTGTGRGAA